MNAKATYYLQLAIMLLMSIMANWGYASAIGTDCVGVRQRWVREFDRHGRELSVTHYLGDGTPMLLCRRGYDSLGRISEESAGDGASEALVNEYAYDIRSRAVAVSSGRYSQRLDFTPGGNVSRMDWCADASCEPWHSYRLGYDALARVVSAEYSDDDGRRGIYDTTYDYDLNGNVTALSRRGVVSSGIGGEKYGLIDCLAYSYEGNRVVSITDDGQEVYSYGAFHFVDGADEAEEYTYDSNGNITSDLNRDISDISYDVNNRPHRIRFSDGGETRYIYGLDGVKRRAEHVIPGIPPVVSIGAAVSGATVTSTTDYSGAFVYEDGELERIHLDCGYLSYRDFSGSRLAEPEYHFYQRDHLGNNRVDLRSDGLVSQITHYYPFGLPMSMGYSPESQRWKFGNKELDRVNGLDLYDFEARAYDPATIRFYRPDDLAHKYH
uniref:RHS repeat domain-containing protein n=1 Tax=Muribaculum intestinale TaxID=1796646 RepID=UPI003EBA0CC4